MIILKISLVSDTFLIIIFIYIEQDFIKYDRCIYMYT